MLAVGISVHVWVSILNNRQHSVYQFGNIGGIPVRDRSSLGIDPEAMTPW